MFGDPPIQGLLASLPPQGNYVLERDELLEAQKPEYDVILCLSLTKWVHLNWGDEGLKRLFKRLYRHLRPGGLLLLEPQAWASYGKRKNLTVSEWPAGRPTGAPCFLRGELAFLHHQPEWLVGLGTPPPRGRQRLLSVPGSLEASPSLVVKVSVAARPPPTGAHPAGGCPWGGGWWSGQAGISSLPPRRKPYAGTSTASS